VLYIVYCISYIVCCILYIAYLFCILYVVYCISYILSKSWGMGHCAPSLFISDDDVLTIYNIRQAISTTMLFICFNIT
jgi:hypothetical protein